MSFTPAQRARWAEAFIWVHAVFSADDRRRHLVEMRTGAICEPDRMRVPAVARDPARQRVAS